MTTLAIDRRDERIGRARATLPMRTWVDPVGLEATRLLVTCVVVLVAFVALLGLAMAVGPIGMPLDGPAAGRP